MIWLNPLTLWVESNYTQKRRKTEQILSCSPEVVTSLLGRVVLKGAEIHCHSHACLLQQILGSEDKQQKDSGEELFIKTKGYQLLEGRRERITICLFPDGQTQSREDVS